MSQKQEDDKIYEAINRLIKENQRCVDVPEQYFMPVSSLVTRVLQNYKRRSILRQVIIISAGSLGGLLGLSQFIRFAGNEQATEIYRSYDNSRINYGDLELFPDLLMTLIVDKISDLNLVLNSIIQSNTLFWISLITCLSLILIAVLKPIDEW